MNRNIPKARRRVAVQIDHRKRNLGVKPTDATGMIVLKSSNQGAERSGAPNPHAQNADVAQSGLSASSTIAEAHAAAVLTNITQANGDDVDFRMAKIEEILGHAAMHLLEKCGLVAEWVRHAEAKLSIFGQPVQKTQRGRPEGGVARAARELRVPGTTHDARRKFIERALKVDGIWPDAKSAVTAAGLDDIQSALLAIAGERSQEAQLAKVQEIAARKAIPRHKSSARASRIAIKQTTRNSNFTV